MLLLFNDDIEIGKFEYRYLYLCFIQHTEINIYYYNMQILIHYTKKNQLCLTIIGSWVKKSIIINISTSIPLFFIYGNLTSSPDSIN